MTWRLAYSLDTLRNQVNAAYPNRSKASDGTIGDAAHASQPSDHNPNPQGVVCALDLTNDPNAGFNAHAAADVMLANRHPDLKFLISNRRIAGDWTGWNWVYYGGDNPHDKHIHISVGVGPEGQSRQPYDDTIKWNIGETDMADKVDDAAARQLLRDYGVTSGSEPDRQPTLEEVKNLIGRTYPDAMAQLRSYQPYSNMMAKYKYYDNDVKTAYDKGVADGTGKKFVPVTKQLFEEDK